MKRRTGTSVIVGVLATIVSFLLLVPSGCADVDGVPSWERCTSVLGTPAFSVEDLGWDNTLDVLPPILIGLLLGRVTWWLLGRSRGTPGDQ